MTIDQFMAIFHDADVDGNKCLGIEELKYHLVHHTHHIELSDFQLKALFRAADDNGDGQVTQEEWKELGSKLLEK